MASNIKKDLINACHSYVAERTARIHQAIADLNDALKLETKCSAGDKYETGRAMLHLEFEKLSAQLSQYAQLKKTLSLLEFVPPSVLVGFGSVVETSSTHYFLAIPAGKFTVEGKDYFAVGVTSPIAKALLGKKAGDTLDFNAKELEIIKVF